MTTDRQPVSDVKSRPLRHAYFFILVFRLGAEEQRCGEFFENGKRRGEENSVVWC
jgi:hypothetical protein